jgi:hypothetical protein
MFVAASHALRALLIASFAGLGQPLGHLTVFDLLFRREIITFWPAGKPCLARA